MQRCSAAVLFGVLLLATSGFATSHNRFETRRILTRTAPPARPKQSGQNVKSRGGGNQGSGNGQRPLRRDLPRSNRLAAPR